MTGPLPPNIGPVEEEVGRAKPSGKSIRHFVFFFDTVSTHFLIGRCPHMFFFLSFFPFFYIRAFRQAGKKRP